MDEPVPAPEFPGLYVTTGGLVLGPSGFWLKQFTSAADVYLHVNWCRPAGRRQLAVHCVVCATFHGPRPAGMFVRHLDGDPHDNWAANLAWGTREQNEADKRLHGTSPQGERHPCAKLTETQVKEVFSARCEGETHAVIAARYGVSPSTISAILTGRTWRHL
jgi:hypothetical protein